MIEELPWLLGTRIETVIGVVSGADRIAPRAVIGFEVIPAITDF